jgi:hypothetical protein
MDPRNKGPVTYLNDAALKNAMTRQPVNDNPLQLNEFKFVLHRIPNTVYMCQGVNLPGISVGENTQSSPYSVKIRRPGTSMDQEDLVIRFIVNENISNWIEIRNWMKSLTGERDFSGNSWEADKYSDATLILMNSKSIPFVKATFQRCWPRQMGSIQFSTTVTDIAPAVCDVSFAYTGYDVEYLNTE